MTTAIGTVAEIWRFPVKSMRGEKLERATLRWTGITGDRQFAFVRSEDKSRFPWLTGRELPEMLLYRALYANPDDPRNSGIGVTAPDGRFFDIWDKELARRLEDAAGEPAHALQLGRGAFDQHPVSAITTRTLKTLTDRAGAPVDPRRFRINLTIAEAPDAPPEEEWLGKTLTFGSGGRIQVDVPASRCVMVTIDPDTAARDPKIMRVVAQDFDNQVGLYCVPAGLGDIAVGDSVFLD